MTFFLHWIDVGTTDAEWQTAATWNASYGVSDEEVLNVRIEHDEGQIPSMVLQVRNPKVGLLNPSRKLWAWFSWDGPGYVEPLFFGRLVGIPTDLLGEAVTLQFTARHKRFVMKKQIAAEALKVRPYYDPVFIDQMKRDDPDSILEGYSALWHIDRTTLDVTPSDVLVGEDGLSIFLPSEVPYDSVKVTLNQSPLLAVSVNADVSWSQEFKGYIDTGIGTIKTYSGDGIMSEWPRPASDLGGGWSVVASFVKDVWHIGTTQNVSYGTSWQNTQRNHEYGDVMSYNISRDYPNFNSSVEYIFREITRESVLGMLDPATKDIYGNDSPTNIPESLKWTGTWVPKWKIKYSMSLRYDANRSRTERVEFILKADAQNILSDALLTEDTDSIQITGADVGQPIINFRNWTSVAGRYVGIGEFIFPDDPTVPGQKSIQVSVVAGVAGTEIPVFSNIAGQTTQDGTVTWASLGYASGIYNISTDWQRYTLVPLGEIILPHVPFSILYKDFVLPGRMQDPKVGTNVDLYFIVEVANKGFYQCSLSGTTGTSSPDWKTTVGSVTSDGSAKWTFIGEVLPTGVDYYICTHSGTTGAVLPYFGSGAQQITDGDVVWTKLAASEVPIGGSPGMIGRNDYFPTDRGNWSLEYLMCLARARLRMRSRAVEVSFDCSFARATKLSCRMNARLYDDRLPGGVATGKIIGYTLSADGDKKLLSATVKMGCSVGRDGSAVIDVGTPTYVADAYVEAAYQEHTDATALVNSDLGYTPPISNVNDKFIFPLTEDQVFLNGGVQQRGSISKQEKGIESALYSAWVAANYAPANIDTAAKSLYATQLGLQASANSVEVNLQKNPMWLELELLPVTNINYDNFYSITTTDLKLPKCIDLEATTTATPPVTVGSVLYGGAAFTGLANITLKGSVPQANAVIALGGSAELSTGPFLLATGGSDMHGYSGGTTNGGPNLWRSGKTMAGASTLSITYKVKGIIIQQFSASGSLSASARVISSAKATVSGAGSMVTVGS